MAAELAANPELDNVCEICYQLGIDDPIEWWEKTEQKTIDLWAVFFYRRNRQQNGDRGHKG